MNLEFGNLDGLAKDHPEQKGWIVGSFIPGESLRHSDACEVKWARHAKGLKKTTGMDLSANIRTIMILVSGKWRTWIPGEQKEIVLSEPGDYLAYDTGEHECEALEDTHLLVVRWKID